MKFLRNLAIYYIVLGLLCGVTFALFGFFWIGVVGLVLLAAYYIAKYFFKVEAILPGLSKWAKRLLSAFLILLPILTLTGIELYYHRSFKQLIVIPDNYEGLVIVAYENGQVNNEAWQDGYRLIKADSRGLAKTSFEMPEHIVATLSETRICYTGNLSKSLPIEYHAPVNHQNEPTAYMVDFTDNYQIYVITSDFNNFFVPQSSNELKAEVDKKLSSIMEEIKVKYH
ncbi:hypothetical protein KHS38_03835 [Mucilaginibacter sp. Bleaf8]|uniref:DUF6843 domain-containing protein n=1 Tax=Mucilaginibacter sp. Bleaf8 TaxID=2834430 RepID=UPI001BCFB77C|nr:hypothetical protein [Mucilaginibacter sp. Bleaf8]MBS7563527.1 hypothetical protein [Mucilaginibacter sp. Bleaf8]